MIRKGMTVDHFKRGRCKVESKQDIFLRLVDNNGNKFIGYVRDVSVIFTSKKEGSLKCLNL